MGGKAGLLAAFNFGSELIVPQIYSPILQGLTHSIGLINEEAKFLILHIDMDEDHAESLREIIISSCRTKTERITLERCTEKLLDARVPLDVREEIYRADEEINDRGVSVDDIDCVDDFPLVQSVDDVERMKRFKLELDGSTRGRLFDVKRTNVNAMD
eukprot:scaffold353_cov201-Alexandrium_tamarense.AAC.21